jgi:hypothetical protein
MAILSLMVAYAVTNVGALRFLFLGRRAPLPEIVFPLGALGFLGYVLVESVSGQEFPYTWFPYVVAAWLAVGLAVVVAVPGLATRIGANLAADQGIAASGHRRTGR